MYYDPVECGRRLRNIRKAIGYTQEDVAAKVNISVSYYGKIESGKKLPSTDILIDLASVLNLSLDFI